MYYTVVTATPGTTAQKLGFFNKWHFCTFNIFFQINPIISVSDPELGPDVDIKTWRGFPNTVTSAVSVRSTGGDGYKYYVFSNSKSHQRSGPHSHNRIPPAHTPTSAPTRLIGGSRPRLKSCLAEAPLGLGGVGNFTASEKRDHTVGSCCHYGNRRRPCPSLSKHATSS